jgi:DNA-binding HxlR family transcriptional regulator
MANPEIRYVIRSDRQLYRYAFRSNRHQHDKRRNYNRAMSSTPPLPGKTVRGSTTGRPVMALLDLLGRRGTLRLLWELRDGQAQSFRQLGANAGDMSPSVMNDRLKELREARLVERVAGGYVLTASGSGLLHKLKPLHQWAEDWAAQS